VDIALSEEAMSVIEQKLASGEFESAEAVVDAAMRLLQARDHEYGEWLRAAVQRGEESVAAGRVVSVDEAFWKKLRERYQPAGS
jgi:putative addiction module CopG family antidote